MAGSLRASFSGALLAALWAADLQGADARIRFRRQGTLVDWGGGGHGGDEAENWHGGWGGVLTFSPNSKLLVRQLDDSTLVVWDLEKQREAGRLGHIARAHVAHFSPDSRQLFVALSELHGKDEKSQVVLWDLKKQAIVRRFEEDRAIFDAEFSRDGRQLVITTHRRRKDDPQLNKVVIYDASTGDEVTRLKVEKRGQEHRVANARLDFSRDGKWLLTSTSDNATIWDAATWQRVRLLPRSSGTWPARFSPDGEYVFSACQARSSNVPLGVRVWNAETGKVVAATTFDLAKNEAGSCWFTLAPDGKSLVTSAWISDRDRHRHLRHIMKFWNVASGDEIVVQSGTGQQFYWWSAARFSPDGETLAIVPWQPRPAVNLMETKYGSKRESLDMSLPEDADVPSGSWPPFVGGLQYSPDGRWLAATRNLPRSREHEVFLWRMETDREPLADGDSQR